MFGLGFPEIMFILLLGVLVLGPEHMPRAARLIGRWSSKMRSAATSFNNAVAADEDLNEVKKSLSEVKAEIDSARNEFFQVKSEISSVSVDTNQAFEQAKRDFEKIRDGNKNTPEKQENEAVQVDAVSQPAQSDFMSRPFMASMSKPVSADSTVAQKNRRVVLARPRFLPEKLSLRVSRRRVPVHMPEADGAHNAVLLAKPGVQGAFARKRRLHVVQVGRVSARIQSCRFSAVSCRDNKAQQCVRI